MRNYSAINLSSEDVKLMFIAVVIFSICLLSAAVIFALVYIARQAKKGKSPETTQVLPPQSNASTADSGEIIAAITAAILAYRSSEESLSPQNAASFRVVSFRRK